MQASRDKLFIALSAVLVIGASYACSSSSGSSSGGSTSSGGTDGGGSTSSSSSTSSTSSSSGGTDSGTDTGASSSSGGTDSGTDTGASSSSGDSGVSQACQDYCTCMATNCATTPPAGSGCLTACASQTSWDLTCRTQHCGFAASDPATHCPHAAGVAVCQ